MDFKQKLIFLSCLFFSLPLLAYAHQPVLEPEFDGSLIGQGLYIQAIKIGDPTVASQALYGSLLSPRETDVFVFVPENSTEIPVEILIPIRPANDHFQPELFIAAKNLPADRVIDPVASPVLLPDGYKLMKLVNQHLNGEFYEPFSAERYWKSEQVTLNLEAKQNYFLLVREPNMQTGDYTLGLGTVENFSDISFFSLLQNIFILKLGLVGIQIVPWEEIIGMFFILAGLIIGLGAVTVIDWHGFLAIRSQYWTESTIRAHKVTKPLIWLGLLLFIIGAVITYRQSWLTGVALFQALIIIVLILNGLFLTFYISPRLLQREKDGDIAKVLPDSLISKIGISFIISFLGWWTLVFLTAWYIVLMS